MAEPDLPALQRWLLGACTAGAGGAAAATVVRGSSRWSAEERVGIYARGYVARVLDCLRAEFPVLRALAGDQVFDLFAQSYLAACPPRSPSLFDLGAGFADHLEATRPRPVGPPDGPDALPAALARLERARLEVRVARGVETDAAHRPLDPFGLMTTPDLVVRTPESLRLLRLAFALADTVAAVDREEGPGVPAAAETFYAVARAGYRVRVHVLAGWQHAFLAGCDSAVGVDLRVAVARTGCSIGMSTDSVWASLLTWLPMAVDAGMATVAARP